MKRWTKGLPDQACFHLAAFLLFAFPAGTMAGEAAVPPAEKPAAQAPALPADKALKLEDAVRTALENHPRIRAAKEKVGAQQAVLGQQFAAYYPTVSLGNTYRTTTASGTTGTSAEAFDFFSSQATFNMTLYNFGKREGAVQSARETLHASQYDYQTVANDIVLAVKQAYYAYLQAQALVKVREEAVKNRALLLRQAQGFFEVGIRPKIDVARAESNLYNAQADLLAAQNAVKIAWVTLKNAMGLKDLPEQPVTEDLSIVSTLLSLEQAKEAAFNARPELKSFEAQRKSQDQQIATARRGHLPDIIFDVNYGRRHASNSGIDTFPLQPSWQVQLSLNIPIFDGFKTTNRVEETLHNYYSVKAQEEDRKQQVALEVEQSYLNMINTQERIKATQAAARAARENLDLANGRYQVGVGSIIEATDAQALYTDAETSYVRTLYDYKIAEAQLQRAMGSP
ncbi:MAG: TolC family protein [Candidatus Binatota bacterium]